VRIVLCTANYVGHEIDGGCLSPHKLAESVFTLKDQCLFFLEKGYITPSVFKLFSLLTF
jgi:hypothetical protein